MRCAGVDAGRGPSRVRVNDPRPYKVRSEKSHLKMVLASQKGVICATTPTDGYRQRQASHIIISLPGIKGRRSVGVCGATGSADDFGRERNSETLATPLSVSDDRRNSGDGAA